MSTPGKRYNEAEKLKDAGQLEEAAAICEAILVDAPEYVLAHLMLGKIYIDLGKPDEAVRHNERACEIEPEEALNHSALSVSYQRAWEATRDPRYIQMAEEAKARSHRIHGS
jgi:tetratricopeptide (TPR) repeat protein